MTEATETQKPGAMILGLMDPAERDRITDAIDSLGYRREFKITQNVKLIIIHPDASESLRAVANWAAAAGVNVVEPEAWLASIDAEAGHLDPEFEEWSMEQMKSEPIDWDADDAAMDDAEILRRAGAPNEVRVYETVTKDAFHQVLAQLDTTDGRFKYTNPKDAVGVRKWRQFFVVPMQVMWEVGVGMLEGALKYGRHNYRASGVRASVYVDATLGHIQQFVEGEDADPDSKAGLSHVTKAICSLVVLRDAMMNDMWVDDRPPRVKDLDGTRKRLQRAVEDLFEEHGDKNPVHYTQIEHGQPESR